MGEKGDAGQPAFLHLNMNNFGVAFDTSNIVYSEMKRFTFSTAMAEAFTALKANIYVSGGVGSLRIQKISGVPATIYENTNITSTSNDNIETATGLDIYPSTGDIIAVQIKHNTGAPEAIFISDLNLYYQ